MVQTKKLLTLSFIFLFFATVAEAKSLIEIKVTMSSYSEYGEELDRRELLESGWRIKEFPEQGSDDFTDDELSELEDVEWTREISVNSEDLTYAQSFCVGEGCLTLNQKGEVSLSFETEDNLAYGELTLPRDESTGEYTPVKGLKLSVRGHDNSTWGFSADLELNVVKRD